MGNNPIIIKGSYFEDEEEAIIKVLDNTSEKEEEVDDVDDDYEFNLDNFFTKEKDNPKTTTKEEGNLGVFLYQSILATIIAIGYTFLSMLFAPISQNFLTTIKTISSNDFSFSTSIYQSIGTFFTYVNEQRPLELNASMLGGIVNEEIIIDDVIDDITQKDIIDYDVIDVIDNIQKLEVDENIIESEIIEEEILQEEQEEILQEEQEEIDEEPEAITTNAVIKELPTNVTLTPIIFAGDIIFPISDYYRVTSDFGFRTNPVTNIDEFHTAYDLAADKGTNIIAVLDGTITDSRTGTDLGNFIIIDHGQGLTSLYGHCDELLVKAGDKVKQGDIIAKVGNTGTSTGNHLHFGMKMDGIYFDPSYIFKEELGGE